MNPIKSLLLKSPSIKTYAENKYNSRRNYIPKEIYTIQRKFKDFTMVHEFFYIRNLMLVQHFSHLQGSIVECGTWKGGMIGGIATLLKNQNRHFYLYDSFEGLPPAQEIDGNAAIEYQQNTDAPEYLDNCAASEDFARKAMVLSGATNVTITKGWFNETLPHYAGGEIAILRLDGDWYDSTMDCLNNLYKHLIPGGIIIIDDYYAWDGCARAIHDFLSKNQYPVRIHQFMDTVCYLVKS